MNLGPAFRAPQLDPATCRHTSPEDYRFSYFARDDRAKDGKVLVIVCMACGTIIQGAYREDEAVPAVRNQVAAAYRPKRKRKKQT